MIGLSLFLLAFLVPLVMGFLHEQSWEETAPRRFAAHAVMLIGLFLVILSKEKVEDEFVDYCRLRAFRAALFASIVYFLMDVFGTFSGNLVHSSFGLLMMQIGVYLLVFHIGKSGLVNGK
jgi:hypothetical protein